jgi:hypothetical protein
MTRWIDNTENVKRVIHDDARQLAEAGAILVRDGIVLEIESYGPRSGMEYRIPGTKAKYRASAEGEPPAVREGRYRESWQYTPAVKTETGWAAFAFTDLMVGPYVLGELLNYGTSRMGPRPHVEPGIERAAQQMETMLR